MPGTPALPSRAVAGLTDDVGFLAHESVSVAGMLCLLDKRFPAYAARPGCLPHSVLRSRSVIATWSTPVVAGEVDQDRPSCACFQHRSRSMRICGRCESLEPFLLADSGQCGPD